MNNDIEAPDETEFQLNSIFGPDSSDDDASNHGSSDSQLEKKLSVAAEEQWAINEAQRRKQYLEHQKSRAMLQMWRELIAYGKRSVAEDERYFYQGDIEIGEVLSNGSLYFYALDQVNFEISTSGMLYRELVSFWKTNGLLDHGINGTYKDKSGIPIVFTDHNFERSLILKVQ